MRYWLLKSEGYTIDDLKRDKTTAWGGVRNYQARNFMTNDMQVGDLCLFYRSGKDASITGVAKVSKAAHPDETQFEKGHYFEPRATKQKPVWFCVDVAFVKKLPDPIPLGVLKADSNLVGMMLLKQGMRLSIQPVSEKQFEYIVADLAKQ